MPTKAVRRSARRRLHLPFGPDSLPLKSIRINCRFGAGGQPLDGLRGRSLASAGGRGSRTRRRGRRSPPTAPFAPLPRCSSQPRHSCRFRTRLAFSWSVTTPPRLPLHRLHRRRRLHRPHPHRPTLRVRPTVRRPRTATRRRHRVVVPRAPELKVADAWLVDHLVDAAAHLVHVLVERRHRRELVVLAHDEELRLRGHQWCVP